MRKSLISLTIAAAVLITPTAAHASPCKHGTTTTTQDTAKPRKPCTTTTVAPPPPSATTSTTPTTAAVAPKAAVTSSTVPVAPTEVVPEDDSIGRTPPPKVTTTIPATAAVSVPALARTGFAWRNWALSGLALIAGGSLCLALADAVARREVEL